MPLAPLIIPAIQGVTSLIGGFLGGNAAKNAAKIQQQAAQGVASKYEQTGFNIGQDLDAAAAGARAGIIDAGGAAANQVLDASGQAQQSVLDQAALAQQGMQGAVTGANATLKSLYDDVTGLTSPYTTAGAGAVNQLAAYVGPGGEGSQAFQFTQDDPSFQWRLQQGQQALARSAAARGAVSGGGVAKALTRYAQGAASTEYQAAFDRFQREREQRYNMLAGLAGIGQNAVGQQIGAANVYGTSTSNNLLRGAEFTGTVGLNAAKTAGDFGVGGAKMAGDYGVNAANAAGQLQFNNALQRGDWTLAALRGYADATLGGANAAAAGKVGGANAWSGAITGIGDAAASALSQFKKFNPGGN